jgi:Reverse transcriptase (RNA-dependent DNA polymerase)
VETHPKNVSKGRNPSITVSMAAPILLADKKNGKVCFCVDYRHLNSVTKQDVYPLPRIDDILAALGKSSIFSTIDLTDAFWSIPIREKDIEKTAFTSKYGLWEFLSMPFKCTTNTTKIY